jgi:pSer/pThr/pTyr-binding forkhead associated (FHA) protein
MPIRMICIDHALKHGPGKLVAGGSYRIGRSSRCAFIVSDLSVSRVHAEITATDEIVLVKDMGSRNGTFIDGVRIEEAQLQAGQLVRFGNVRFQVIGELSDDEAPSDLSELSTRFIPGKPTRPPTALQEMSSAQLRVLKLLLTGLREKEIAAKLYLSPHTVHNHVKEIFRKMNVKSRPALLALFVADARKPKLPAE